jgi:hypothetical protein
VYSPAIDVDFVIPPDSTIAAGEYTRPTEDAGERVFNAFETITITVQSSPRAAQDNARQAQREKQNSRLSARIAWSCEVDAPQPALRAPNSPRVRADASWILIFLGN